MRALVSKVIEELVTRYGTTTRIDLNDIAEVIGDRAVTYEEVDHIITDLEARGCRVGGEPTVREMELLREVLVAARELHATLGRRPTVVEIADSVKHPTFVVRRAVENGGAMGSAK